MKQSTFFTRTSKDVSKEEVSINAKLLTRAGFVDRHMAGVYSILPLGVRVLTKIENIIREEMNAVGGQEVLMPALQSKEVWEQTGRWDTVDILFKLRGHGERDLALGPTHEEIVTPLVGQFVQSYRDLPISVYQLQTKFRNEARAKSGVLRGREFRMKDMYSFHRTSEDLDQYYERVLQAYVKIFDRIGIGAATCLTVASGGMFCKYSHEFQTVTPFGEDLVYRVPGENFAINKEIIDDHEAVKDLIPKKPDGTNVQLEEVKAIEVGNIFKLGTRFADAFKLSYLDEKGASQKIHMGCYGIGPTRILGTLVECFHDANGLVWPEAVAPFLVHLVSLGREEAEKAYAENIYSTLLGHGIECLFDDRDAVQPGQKFVESDLLGIPHRLVVSKKTISKGCIEWRPRTSEAASLVTLEEFLQGVKR